MSKFKTGDIVGYEGASGKVGPLVVDYQRTNSTGVWLTKGTWIEASRLFLWDDELPPAPESVLYVNAYKWGIRANNLGDELKVGVGDPNSPEYGWTYASLDADTALQICHDLRRMAMEIKRKIKITGA